MCSDSTITAGRRTTGRAGGAASSAAGGAGGGPGGRGAAAAGAPSASAAASTAAGSAGAAAAAATTTRVAETSSTGTGAEVSCALTSLKWTKSHLTQVEMGSTKFSRQIRTRCALGAVWVACATIQLASRGRLATRPSLTCTARHTVCGSRKSSVSSDLLSHLDDSVADWLGGKLKRVRARVCAVAFFVFSLRSRHVSNTTRLFSSKNNKLLFWASGIYLLSCCKERDTGSKKRDTPSKGDS